MKKTIKTLSLILVLLFVFTACGETEDTSKTNDVSFTENNVSVEVTSGESEISDASEVSDTSKDSVYNEGDFYILYTESKIDFSEAPKAEIKNYPWNSDYTPYAYAQVIFKKNDGFYLFMYCEESNPKTEITEIGGNVYRDSAMEFFCDYYPDGKKNEFTTNYINLEMNSAGVYLAHYRNESVLDLSMARIKVKSEKFDNYWTLTAHIPMKLLKDIYGDIEIGEGSVVECNFTKCGSGTDIPHWGTWQPLGGETPNFHQPKYFKAVEIRK